MFSSLLTLASAVLLVLFLQGASATFIKRTQFETSLDTSHEQCFMAKAKTENATDDASDSPRKASFLNRRTISNGALFDKCDWNPTKVDDLANQYNDIFGSYGMNRNAASHLWAEFILSRSDCLSHEQIVHMFSGFCAVSGSPLGEPSGQSRFKQELQLVNGGSKTGYSYHCCWPCFCDEREHIKVDSKDIVDKSGTSKTYYFEVIGDPCKNNPSVCPTQGQHESCIPLEAPAVKCTDGALEKSIKSDGGHVIIGMYFTDDKNLADSIDGDEKLMQKDDGSRVSLNEACTERANSGFSSGMGTIFINVAKLNPI